MSALVLHYTPGACSLASHIVLEECGAIYQSVEVDIRGGENRGAAYLAINPLGTVPVLMVDSAALTETVAIVSYLGRVFPERGLLPADPLHEAQCIALVAWLSSTAHPVRRQNRLPQRYTADEAAYESVRAMGKKKFWDCCCLIDERLRGRTWAMGEVYSVADAMLLLICAWAFADGYPLGDLAAFTAFRDRMLARPAVRRVLEREGNGLVA